MKALLVFLMGIQLALAAQTIPQSTLNHVADEIDNICGDTWCEGDFNWNFDNLRCDLSKGICEMDLILIDQFYIDDYSDSPNREELIQKRKKYVDYLTTQLEGSYGENDEDGLQFHYPQTCAMYGFKTVEDVVDGNSYSQKLYESVSDCVSEMEDDFYSVPVNY